MKDLQQGKLVANFAEDFSLDGLGFTLFTPFY